MDIAEKVKALEMLRDKLRDQYDMIYQPDKVEIGDFTYGTPIIRTWGEDAKLKIGKFCSIGMDVRIYLGGNHHNEWCTTYPFNAILPQVWGDIDGGKASTKGDVIIGNDVWIADNVMIMSGVKIGDGATIAAGAVVSKDVPAYAVMAGNPAEVKAYRGAASLLCTAQWWDWPLDKLAEAVPFLLSGNTMLEV